MLYLMLYLMLSSMFKVRNRNTQDECSFIFKSTNMILKSHCTVFVTQDLLQNIVFSILEQGR